MFVEVLLFMIIQKALPYILSKLFFKKVFCW